MNACFPFLVVFFIAGMGCAQQLEISERARILHPSDKTAALSQANRILPIGTPISACVDDHVPMRRGAQIHARLLYPVFIDNKLALPPATILNGTVIDLVADHLHRLNSRLRGDFTPFSVPTVRFESIALPDGRSFPVSTELATTGAPIFSLVPPPPRKGGFLHQQLDIAKQMAKDRLAMITGPNKRDRLVQFAYTQLPYHPQRIEKGTAWTVETTMPAIMPAEPEPAGSSLDADHGTDREEIKSATVSEGAPVSWLISASLKETLSSESTAQGTAIHANVMQPVFNPDHTVAVPQGSVLDGIVTQVRPARRFGRAGVLRFDFRQLTVPEQHTTQDIQASLNGVDAAGGKDLALDSEGRLKPKPQDKLAVPLLLFALASRPLDRDGGDGAFGKNAVASNSLGLAGFVIGTAGGWRNVAAGIGYYGTALAVYNRWIKRGQEVTFTHDTRILVQTTVRRSTPLNPNSR